MLRRALPFTLLIALGCEPIDVWIDRCLAAGTCREDIDAGAKPDAGAPRIITCTSDLPSSAPYADRVATEWACVRDDLIASRVEGTNRRTGVGVGQTSVYDADLTALHFDGGAGFGGGVVLPNGEVWGLPDLRRAVLVVPPDGSEPKVVQLNAVPAALEARATSGGVLGPDGSVILCPGGRALFARLAPPVVNGELTAVVHASPQSLLYRWDGCVVAPGIGVFAFPATAGAPLLHLPFDGGEPEAWALRSDGGSSGAALLPSGEVVGIPRWPSADFVLVDPVRRTERSVRHRVSASDTVPATQLNRAVMSLTGQVLALPGGMYGRWGVAVSDEGQATQAFRNAPAFTSGGALSPTGDIFLAPSENSVVPAFDAERSGDNAAIVPPDSAGRTFSNGFTGGVTRPDGTIVFIPSTGDEVLVVRTRAKRPLSTATVTSPFLDRY